MSANLQLGKISIKEDYRKEWNIRMDDFLGLSLNGELIRPTLYRKGGLNTPNLKSNKYFMLIKHIEAFYPDRIMKNSGGKDPKHLAERWCILDKNGIEKVEFSQSLNYPYLVKNSCMYSIDRNYYNIETGEHYCKASKSMESDKYLFLENSYDKEKSKRGVMKINKETGISELFS